MSAFSKTAARKRSSGEKDRNAAVRATSPSVGSGTVSGGARRPADNPRGGPPDGRAWAIPATANIAIPPVLYQTEEVSA
jgi:hypothetical protein